MFDTLKRFWKKLPFGDGKALFIADGKIVAEPYEPPVIPIPQSVRWSIVFLPHKTGALLYLTHEAAFKGAEIIRETGPKIRMGRFLWTKKSPLACNFIMERDAQRFGKEFIVANELGMIFVVPAKPQKSNAESQPDGEDPGESLHEKVHSDFENDARPKIREEDPKECDSCGQLACRCRYYTR
jgi:hypothetical protein